MPLTIADRKHLMPHGAQKEIASALGVSKSYVSSVVNGEIRAKTQAARRRLRIAQVAIARKLGKPVDEVFPPARPEPAPLTAVA